MSGVDHLSQLRKNYGYDKKSKRYWLRAFFQFLDYAVDNAFILYKHNYKYYRVKACKLLDFRLDLVHLLLKDKRNRERSSSSSSSGAMDDVRVEWVVWLSPLMLACRRAFCSASRILARSSVGMGLIC